MRVKAIMMPFSRIACISVDNTVEEAMQIIDEQRLLPSGRKRQKSLWEYCQSSICLRSTLRILRVQRRSLSPSVSRNL